MSTTTKVSPLVLPTIALSLMTVVSAVAGLNLALPSIATETGATQTQLTWIVDSYTVVFAGLLLLAGAIGDRIGRQRSLLLGLAVFAIGASLGFVQTDPEGLILARVIMGVGAAFIMPSTLSVITTSFPPEKRGKAIGVWVGVAGGGAVLGLFATAFLMEYFEWNSFFALNIGLAAISILGTLLVPDSKDAEAHKLDLVGGLLSVLGVGGVVFGIIEGPERGWDSIESLAGLTLGVLSLIVFVFWELRVEHPLLDPRLFKLRGFSSGSLSITVQFFAQFGFIFVGMQYLQFVAGLSPLEAATQLLWMPLVVLPGSRIAGMLSQKVSQKILGSLGLAIFGYAMFHFANLPVDFDYWYFTTGILLFGTGLSLSATPATVAITEALPAAKQGVASAVNDTAREVGSAVGIAILGAALTDAYKGEMVDATVGLPAQVAEKLQSSVAFTQMPAPAGMEQMWGKLVEAGLEAFNVGVQNSLTIAGWVAIGGAVVVAAIAPYQKQSVNAE
jgi:EmrB/QacA subfamily drug resistance transporter